MTEKTSTVLKESWYFFTANFFKLALFSLPFFLISLFSSFYGFIEPKNQLGDLLHVLDITLLPPLLNGGLLLLIHSLANTDDNISVKETLMLCLSFYFPLLVVSFISETLTTIGFLLLIVPGVWVMVRLFLAPLYVLFQDLTAMDALKSSFNDSKDLFKEFLIPTLPLITITIVMIFLAGKYESSNNSIMLLNDLLTTFIFMFFSIVQYRLYSIHIKKMT